MCWDMVAVTRQCLNHTQQPVTWHLNSPSFVLRCGREVPLAVLVASLGRTSCCVCGKLPDCPQARFRVSNYNYSPCWGWL